METIYFHPQVQGLPETSPHITAFGSTEHIVNTATATARIVPPQIPNSQNGVPVNISDHDASVNFQGNNSTCGIFSATATGVKHNSLMTCHVRLKPLKAHMLWQGFA